MSIELSDLTDEERVALVGLMELMARSGTTGVSEDEADFVARIVAALGETAYDRAADEVDRRFQDEDALRTFLSKITRQDARELIYGTVLSEAMAGAVDSREAELLDWLAAEWEIDTSIEESDG